MQQQQQINGYMDSSTSKDGDDNTTKVASSQNVVELTSVFITFSLYYICCIVACVKPYQKFRLAFDEAC